MQFHFFNCFLLSRVGETLTQLEMSKAREIARLTAQLRKAEMNVSSLEEQIDQKVRSKHFFLKSDKFFHQTQENKELTTMCDDLLAKVETAS